MLPEQTVANLETVLTAPAFTDLSPGNFSYIDLRFGNKVFVNEEQIVTTSTPVTAASSTTDAPSTSDGAGGLGRDSEE